MIYLLTDVDDTLMQTSGKMPEGSVRHPGAVDANGENLSYLSENQKTMYELFQKNSTVIPVTGRSSWAMDRVKLPFDSYKVVSHGAIILDKDNNPVNDWIQSIRSEVDSASAFMNDCFKICSDIIQERQLEVKIRFLEDHGVPVYLSFKGKRDSLVSLSHIDILSGALEDFSVGQESTWRIHKNGRNMAFLPPYTCKRRACEWLIKHIGIDPEGDLILTAGDSTSDLAFMGIGNVMMIPASSQIVDQHFK